MRISDWSSDVCSADLVISASQSSSWEAGRALRAGNEPTIPALHCAMTSWGFETRNIGELMTGRRRLRARMAGSGMCIDSRSEEHTSELQSLMRISYAVFCLKKKKTTQHMTSTRTTLHHTTPTDRNTPKAKRTSY